MGEHESLAAIAGQLAEVHDELDRVRTAVATFQARLDTETGPVMVLPAAQKRLRDQVEELRKQVEEIAAELAKAAASGKADGPAPARWDGEDQAAQAAQLDDLRTWVEGYLRPQYPGYLSRLPPCWVNHREGLWELAALQAEWKRVFGSDGEPPLADVQWWHERWLPGALNRLRDTITCSVAKCTLVKDPAREAANAHARQAWDRAETMTHTGRMPRPDGRNS